MICNNKKKKINYEYLFIISDRLLMISYLGVVCSAGVIMDPLNW